jgi:hypothetical protein
MLDLAQRLRYMAESARTIVAGCDLFFHNGGLPMSSREIDLDALK